MVHYSATAQLHALQRVTVKYRPDLGSAEQCMAEHQCAVLNTKAVIGATYFEGLIIGTRQ
jgi:hypothetical protein